MPKFYFSELNEEKCYTRKSMLDWMEGEGMVELKVYPAIMMTGENFFYCTVHEFCGESGEGCGKECEEYEPRNGKNGRCRYSNNCYEPDHKNPEIFRIDTNQ